MINGGNKRGDKEEWNHYKGQRCCWDDRLNIKISIKNRLLLLTSTIESKYCQTNKAQRIWKKKDFKGEKSTIFSSGM